MKPYDKLKKLEEVIMAGENKYIICCDFDGVLHSYTSGWKGPTVIPDPPVAGALEWLLEMVRDDRFQIAIYSSRSKEPGGIAAMREWLRTYLSDYYRSSPGVGPYIEQSVGGDENWVIERLTFPTQKPAASMTIDDRAFHFQGTFPTVDWLLKFKPWTKHKHRQKRLLPRPSADRIDEIRAVVEDLLDEVVDGGQLDRKDQAMAELLGEIDHLQGVLGVGGDLGANKT